jgi:hypothetical protein
MLLLPLAMLDREQVRRSVARRHPLDLSDGSRAHRVVYPSAEPTDGRRLAMRLPERAASRTPSSVPRSHSSRRYVMS